MALALKVAKVETIAGNFFVEPHIINASEASAKEITLVHNPSKPDEVIIDIPGGTPQRNGIDFKVNGNVLTWDGWAMETLIEEGDYLRVTYIL